VHSKADRAEKRAKDILAAIATIAEFIGEMDQQAFNADRKTRSAVERQLLIIAEAADHRFEHRFPNIPIHKIRGMGNILRHEYPSVDEETVWETATGPALKELRDALERYGPFP